MDWIKCYWNDGIPITEASYRGRFILDVSKIVINDSIILDRAVEAVETIVKNNPPPYRLFVSGGIDSQSMLYAWKKSGVEFEAHSFIYDQNMNLHDLSTLWDYVKQHNIKVNYHYISHFDFLKKDVFEYSKKYNCNSPQITFYMAMMDRFNDGTIVLSGNPPLSTPYLNFTLLGLDRYRIINKKNVVPFFWMHTAELAGSWIPLWNNYQTTMLKDKFELGHGNEMKAMFYHEANIPVISSYKKSGFEKYKIFYDSVHIDSALRMRLLLNTKKNNKSKRNYDILFRFSLIYENPISSNFEMIGI